MANSAFYVGQRLSLKKQTCTVRYVGPVVEKTGEWLGVEWDDPTRGKHDGTHAGTTYFQCRSTSSTAGSFLRPKQPWDESRSFLQALREKYISPEDATNAEVVYISGKHAEEVGLEKFAKRQAQLQGIHTLVLDRICMRHHSVGEGTASTIAETCANITSLDLGGNLFETWAEVANLCRLFPKLSSLTLDGNRMQTLGANGIAFKLQDIHYLSLADTLVSPAEVSTITQTCMSIRELRLAGNGLRNWTSVPLPDTIRTVDLTNNGYTTLSDAESLWQLPSLQTLTLKDNQISAAHQDGVTIATILSSALLDLDLRNNAVSSWAFFHPLSLAFPSLRHLRVAGNPLYTRLTSADGKPLNTEDGYMLSIARMPQLETLNYSKITDKERLNAETYYLGQIAIGLSKVDERHRATVIAEHPRWEALCAEYGEPSFSRRAVKHDQFDPNSLAGRLAKIRFCLQPTGSDRGAGLDLPRMWTEEVPKSLDIYGLLGRVGKHLGILPLELKLVWETGERDPVRAEGSDKPEVWDSSDEDEKDDRAEWTDREVELVPGTRALGTYIEGTEATMRVEMV